MDFYLNRVTSVNLPNSRAFQDMSAPPVLVQWGLKMLIAQARCDSLTCVYPTTPQPVLCSVVQPWSRWRHSFPCLTWTDEGSPHTVEQALKDEAGDKYSILKLKIYIMYNSVLHTATGGMHFFAGLVIISTTEVFWITSPQPELSPVICWDLIGYGTIFSNPPSNKVKLVYNNLGQNFSNLMWSHCLTQGIL